MYVIVGTRLYISHAMGVVIVYMNNPGKEHWKTINLIINSLGKLSELCFGGSNNVL
jgi:hypothetical protein